MPQITLSSGNIFYSDEGSGQPLILLHANLGDRKDFDAIVPTLAKVYRVITLDWPGYGKSSISCEPKTVSANTFLVVLKEFFCALFLPPSIIIGNSVGGNVAARFAVAHLSQVKALLLVAPGGFTNSNLFTRSFCRMQGSAFSLHPKIFASLYLKHRNEYTKAMLERASFHQAESQCVELNRAIWRSFNLPDNDLRIAAKAISVPTLLIFGKFDPVILADKDGKIAEECIPGSELVILPSGHAPFAETPDEFLCVLERFFEKLS